MRTLLVVIGFLVIYPLLMLVYGSFRGGGPGTPSGFSLQGYVAAFTTMGNYGVLWTTIWLSALRMALSVGVAIFLAWVVTRTDTPWRGGLEVLIWMVFLGLPYLPALVGWTLLAGPKGFINQALMAVLPLDGPLINIYSYGGIVWASTTFWASIIFILITPAFRGMDAALEESSRMSGANTFTTIRHITVPVLAPAILGVAALTFVRLMESFETELILGYPAEIYVFTTRIWWLLGTMPADFPQAMALSSIFMAVVSLLIITQWRLIGQRQYVTISGRGFATRPTPLGRWRYVTFGLVLLYFVLAFILPFLTLILGSFMKLWGVWQAQPFTLQNWTSTLADPNLLLSVKNTLIVGFGAATVGMILYSLISYIVVRTKLQGQRLLDIITWLPYGVPALVLALGFLWAYIGVPFLSPLFGTVWLLILVFLVRGMPLGCRVMNGSMHQLGYELEECSRVLGASWMHTFRRIVAPLLSPAFISAWLILFALTVRDVVTVMFLYMPGSKVISIALLEHWIASEYEQATVYGVIMGLLTVGAAFASRYLGRKQQLTA
ncbi:MAG: ABC transporter permease [Dehalococcoidia bacterium]